MWTGISKDNHIGSVEVSQQLPDDCFLTEKTCQHASDRILYIILSDHVLIADMQQLINEQTAETLQPADSASDTILLTYSLHCSVVRSSMYL